MDSNKELSILVAHSFIQHDPHEYGLLCTGTTHTARHRLSQIGPKHWAYKLVKFKIFFIKIQLKLIY